MVFYKSKLFKIKYFLCDLNNNKNVILANLVQKFLFWLQQVVDYYMNSVDFAKNLLLLHSSFAKLLWLPISKKHNKLTWYGYLIKSMHGLQKVCLRSYTPVFKLISKLLTWQVVFDLPCSFKKLMLGCS